MALILLPRVLWTILKVLQKFEISHLSVEVPNIKIWTLLSFSRDFLRFISCFLQMTIVVLPRALKTISTILYKIGIGQFGAKVTNIAIWVLFSLSYKFFYFSPIFLQMAIISLLMIFKVNLKTLRKFEISHLSVEVININIWVSRSHNFLYCS